MGELRSGACVAALLVVACAFDPPYGEGPASDGLDETSTSSASSASSPATSAGSGAATTNSMTTSESTSGGPSTEGPDASDTAADTEDDATGGGLEDGCPRTLPMGWIYCQDFEDLDDPASDFDPFLSDGGDLSVADDEAYSGKQSLRIRYRQSGDEWSGEAWVRFGDAPSSGPVFAPDEQFDEVWVRMYVRTQEDWPDAGFGGVCNIESLATNDARVASVGLIVPPTGEAIGVHATTCITGGNQLECDGTEDWLTDTIVAAQAGSVSVSGAVEGPRWHCIVAHMRLDTPQQADGRLSVTVDGTLDVEIDGLDLRGDWDAPGINVVKVTSFWRDGPSMPVDRYVDDLTIASVPLACD